MKKSLLLLISIFFLSGCANINVNNKNSTINNSTSIDGNSIDANVGDVKKK